MMIYYKILFWTLFPFTLLGIFAAYIIAAATIAYIKESKKTTEPQWLRDSDHRRT